MTRPAPALPGSAPGSVLACRAVGTSSSLIWRRQCMKPAKGRRTMLDGFERVELPACGIHMRETPYTVSAYRRQSERYEHVVVHELKAKGGRS